MREGDGVVLNNVHYTSSPSSILGQSHGTYRAANHIKLVHWNAQGAITKTSAIKTAIMLDLVLS